MKLKVTCYPNNETRIALYPERLPKDYLKESSLSPRESQAETTESKHSLPVEGSDSLYSPVGTTFNIMSKVDTLSRTRRSALSRNGRRQILRSGSCFDSSNRTERLLLTGTLPGTGNKAHKAISEFSSYASKTLCNWLTRRAPQAAWQYVWEYQQRGALHIHCVVELPPTASAYVKAHFKDEWNRILRAICRLSGVDLYAKTKNYSHSEKTTQADVTICTREPSRYISKYISKASTHAKAFGRFPPKTWYQISRSLLARLRSQTKVFELEHLSYAQARSIEENARTAISKAQRFGSNLFAGRCYSWSGYCYGDSINLQEISEKLMTKTADLVSTNSIAKLIRGVLKQYPATQCAIRAVTHSRTFDLMDRGMLSETELLLYIQTAIKALNGELEHMQDCYVACRTLNITLNWWQSKFGYVHFDDERRALIVKTYEENLTSLPLCTKVESRPTKFEQIGLFDRAN